MIADFPSGAGFDSVLWQVSITAITSDCPFSNLPGLDRKFTVIEGDGVELESVDETTGTAARQRVLPLQPYAFSGDWRTTCRLLGGPVHVFNVMTRRGHFAATVAIRTTDREIQIEKAAGEVLVAVDLRSTDAWLFDAEAAERCVLKPEVQIAAIASISIM